jgi:hypothetical protein
MAPRQALQTQHQTNLLRERGLVKMMQNELGHGTPLKAAGSVYRDLRKKQSGLFLFCGRV